MSACSAKQKLLLICNHEKQNSAADWNKETKQLEVTFDDAKTNLDKIEVAIAKVGHDTPHHKTTTEVYDKLPGCCKYERTGAGADPHAGHKH